MTPEADTVIVPGWLPVTLYDLELLSNHTLSLTAPLTLILPAPFEALMVNVTVSPTSVSYTHLRSSSSFDF